MTDDYICIEDYSFRDFPQLLQNFSKLLRISASSLSFMNDHAPAKSDGEDLLLSPCFMTKSKASSTETGLPRRVRSVPATLFSFLYVSSLTFTVAIFHTV